MATVPAIPDIGNIGEVSAALRVILQSIKQAIEIREGRRGDNTSGDKFLPRSAIIVLLSQGASDLTQINLGPAGIVYFGPTRRLVCDGTDLLYQELSSGSWSTTTTIAG